MTMLRNLSQDHSSEDSRQASADADAVVDMTLDDGVERMAAEGGVATEIPHKPFPSQSANTEEGPLEQ